MKIIYTNQRLASFLMVREGDLNYLTSELFPRQKIGCSPRFWRSLWKACKIDEDLFKYFSSEEIFAKVIALNGDRAYRFCIEENGDAHRMLGLSLPDEEVVSLETVLKVIRSEETLESGYHDGVVFSVSEVLAKGTKVSGGSVNVSPLLLRRFPIDGLDRGKQVIGVAIADSYLFFDAAKSAKVTKGVVLEREHFVRHRVNKATRRRSFSVVEAMYLRLEAAQVSAASLREIARFFKVCDRFGVAVDKYDEQLSHPFEAYGLSSYNASSETRLSRLPTKASVFDLLEVMAASARDFPVMGRWRLYELAGDLLTNYFDFEAASFAEIIAETSMTGKPANTANTASVGGGDKLQMVVAMEQPVAEASAVTGRGRTTLTGLALAKTTRKEVVG